MELVAFSAEGYRRFAEKATVKLVGSLIAFVGPNEAGKSSLLSAMASLHTEDPFVASDCPRRSSLTPSLSWHFKLSAADKAALVDIHDADCIERAVITRRWQADDRWVFEPRNPVREKAHRIDLAESIEAHREMLLEHEIDPELIDGCTDLLRSDNKNFKPDEIGRLQEFKDACANESVSASSLAEDEEADADSDEPEEVERTVSTFSALADRCSRVASLEGQPSPFAKAKAVLRDRLPKIHLFEETDRDLRSEYDLAQVAHDPPEALNHLVVLAGLRLATVLEAITDGRHADVSTYRNEANRKLAALFDESWNQTGVAIQLEIDGETLLIQATTPADGGLSSISERSDGMRWFAALLAYAHGWRGPTILLADEIETHLHYDAQADLLDVLQRQTFAEKVLYTTHSFGSLPPDLGAGVRVVRPVDAGRSKIENGFWAEGSGFSPLLAGMGATALSFTPARTAVIAEGPADAVLLPTLLRQANDVVRLGYQVVPGLSAVARSSIGDLSEEAGRTFFLTDSDEGGADLRRLLKKERVPDDRIFELDPGGKCELEDLVTVQSYVDAVNAEIEAWQETDDRVTAEDFEGHRLRTKVLASWCKNHAIAEPDKVAVAQRLVELGAEKSIFSADHHGRLVTLHTTWRPKDV